MSSMCNTPLHSTIKQETSTEENLNQYTEKSPNTFISPKRFKLDSPETEKTPGAAQFLTPTKNTSRVVNFDEDNDYLTPERINEG